MEPITTQISENANKQKTNNKKKNGSKSGKTNSQCQAGEIIQHMPFS